MKPEELTEVFRDLSAEDAQFACKLWEARNRRDDLESLLLLRELPYRDFELSSRLNRRLILKTLDRLLDMHGVEALKLKGSDWDDGPRYLHLNAGDPYAATLLLDCEEDRLWVGCWGDLVEANENLTTYPDGD